MAKALSYNVEVEPDDEDSDGHPEIEDIGKFVTGELTGQTRRDVEQHLAGCDHCRQELLTHLKFAAAPASAEELQLLQMLPGMSVAEQVEHVLQQFPSRTRRPLSGRRVLDWLEDIFVSPIAAPAIAMALVIVISLAGLRSNQMYQQYRAETAKETGYSALRREWFLSSDDLRPSIKKLDATGFSRPRGPVPNAAEKAFQEALRRQPAHREARLGLAVFYTFSGRLFAADSLVQVLIAQDATDAEAWNQRGLVQARMENHEAALAAFVNALRFNPSYLEASYNRAQLLTQMQRNAEALQAWQDYLQRDTDSDWAKVARAKIQILQTP